MKKIIFGYALLSLVASAINYATYPILGRLLPASQYVDITVSLSLLTQMSTFLASIVAITIGLSKSETKGDNNAKIEALQSMLFKLFLGIIIVFLLVSPMVMQRIHVPLPFVLPISLMMLVSIPIAIVSGFLTGRKLMVKLGILTVTSAFLQCTVASIVALTTNNGLVAMISMSAAQIITITVIYHVFRRDKLPKISEALIKRKAFDDRKYMTKLVAYTFLSSLAIMALNIVQIADLLLVQAANNGDAKFYTDIYVISRVVFFAGMIFIWPFLSEINVTHHHLNRKPVAKALAFFTIISAGAVSGLLLFGHFITHLLFGVSYSSHSLHLIGTLSVLYKFFFLIVTAIVLYFIVLRDYLAVWIGGLLTIIIGLYGATVQHTTSTLHILVTLNIIAGAFTIASVVFLLTRRIRSHA